MKSKSYPIACILFISVLGACGGSKPSPHFPTTSPSSTVAPVLKAPGDANVGDRTTCLVSHEEFTIEPESPKVEFKGKTYYLCCAMCTKKFMANPEKFVNPEKS